MRQTGSTPPTIVLMGLRGCGKSTLGRSLASTLDRPFVDLDDRTPGLLGEQTAADAINTQGLAAFREAERRALAAVLNKETVTPIVLALGGGTPTAPGAPELLGGKASAGEIVLVYLHAAPSVLRDRLTRTDTATRPSLTGADMLDEIETIYLQRDAAYRDLATMTIESAQLDAKPDPDEQTAAKRVLEAIRARTE